MDADRWDSWLERLILGLVAGALGFGILAFGAVRVREWLVVEALVTLALGLWFLRMWIVRSHRLLWPPVAWGVLLFAGWAAWRTWDADLPYVAWGEFSRIAAYTALFFVVVNNLHRQDTAQGLVWILVTFATLLCFYGAWQFASGANTTWGFVRSTEYLRRASGSFMSPNSFAGLLELLIPPGIALVIAGRMKPLGRIALAYAVLVMLAGLALTFSRGGWIAGLAGMLFVLVPLARQRDYRWPALVCLAIVLIAGTATVVRTSGALHRWQAAQDLNPAARNSRPHIWSAAWRMWQDHPWLGVGPAHFAERFKQYRTFMAHGEPERAHNDYLDALADWGAAGTAAAAIPWALLGYGVLRTLRQVRRDPGDLEVKRSTRYAFVLGASAGLGALLVHAWVDFNFHIPGIAMVAVTWIALLAGYSRYATDNWWVSSRVPWRIPVSLLIILPLAGFLVTDLTRRGRETLHLDRANRAAVASEERERQLLAAWKVEPRNAWTAYHIGEIHRLRSFVGATGYEAHARKALEWFDRAAALHPYEPAFRFRAGMCWDWLGDHDRAGELFQAAHRLDPEGRITSFYMGWHALQTGNREAAREWFVKSAEQGWPQYPPALKYLELLRQPAPLTATPPAADSGRN